MKNQFGHFLKNDVIELLNEEIEIASWQGSQLLSNNGAVINSTLGLSGHYVEWAIPLDTNKTAATNVSISVHVNDAGANSNNVVEFVDSQNKPRTESNKFSSENWGYNSMTVDVVPYIMFGLAILATISDEKLKNVLIYLTNYM